LECGGLALLVGGCLGMANNMNQSGPNPYLRTKILTASPEELRLMLYDGALKFARQARTAIENGKVEEGYNAVMRTQKIVLELSSSLNHQVDAKLCEKLSALYTYIYRLLVDAHMDRVPAKIDEAVKLLEYERETWVMLMRKTGQDPAAKAKDQITGAQQTAMSTYARSA